MIDFIQGILFSIETDSVIVNVSGIGYKIYVVQPENYQLLLNETCIIYTHHHMREDWMGLYGFKNKEERSLFRLLLNVSGIGPKGALAIISQSNTNQIIQAIANADEDLLVKMPGVGKKTAQRIILDLKDKVQVLNHFTNINDKTTNKNSWDLQNINDLRDSLKTLGYQDNEINQVLKSLSNEITEETSLDLLIKKSLRILSKE
ncbi:MAG: Holliday junction branch migration protein RuvA [Vulcanibacillus sp.]